MPKKSIEQTDYVPRDSTLNFEQRILNADNSPTLFEPGLYGSIDNIGLATHKMMWSGNDDTGYVVFPSVVQRTPLPVLEELSPRDAYAYAMNTGEYRSFNTAKEAADYAEAINSNSGYKRDWNANNPNGNNFDDWVAREQAGYQKYGDMYNFIKQIQNSN